MADYRLTVQLKTSPGEDVRLDDFLNFLFVLQKVLNATDRTVSHSDEPTTYYRVADLSHSSPATVILRAQKREADLDMRTAVLTTFVGGMSTILAGSVPSGWGTSLLLDFREMGDYVNGHIRAVHFAHAKKEVLVSATFNEKIEAIVGPDRREQGTVSGMVDIVHAHRRPFFWLYPQTGQERIKCYFPQHLLAKVGGAIRRFVTVEGTLRFKAGMLKPYAVTVRDIDPHERDVDLPSLASLRGIASGDYSESSEDLVRRLRDGW